MAVSAVCLQPRCRRPPALISNIIYNVWLDAMRAQLDRLGTTHSAVNEYVGLQQGYIGKPLSTRPVKNAGGPTLLWLSNALGYRVILEEDNVLLAEVSKRLPKTVGHKGLMLSKKGGIWISPDAVRLNARKGNLKRQQILGAEGRRELARRAAAVRWSKPNARGIAARQARARWRRRKQAERAI